MKNLANCTPKEFLSQTVKIRKYVADWLTISKIAEIRKQKPVVEEGASVVDNQKAVLEQAQSNLLEIFDLIFEENADKTLGLLALLNFVEPEKVNDYPMSEYLKSVSELLSNDAVIGFFTSLPKLANAITSMR